MKINKTVIAALLAVASLLALRDAGTAVFASTQEQSQTHRATYVSRVQ
jgi:hypothetical protein